MKKKICMIILMIFVIIATSYTNIDIPTLDNSTKVKIWLIAPPLH